MSLLRDNIRKLMNHYGYSGAELARRAGLTQPTVHKIIVGSSKDPRPQSIEKIARALGTTYENLRRNESILDKSTVVGSDAILTPSPQMRGYAPMVSWKEVCDLESVDRGQIDKNQLFPLPPGAGPSTVALQVRGDAMSPQYNDGNVVFMDPDVKPCHGDAVVVVQKGKAEATLKQLIMSPGEEPLLKVINPSWPTPWVAMDDTFEILGVVVSSLWMRGK